MWTTNPVCNMHVNVQTPEVNYTVYADVQWTYAVVQYVLIKLVKKIKDLWNFWAKKKAQNIVIILDTEKKLSINVKFMENTSSISTGALARN